MLYIETTIAETSWLNYLLEEFCRIEKAEFNFEITSAPPEGSNIVKYDQIIGDIHLAQNKGAANCLEIIDENLFILNGTQNASFKGEFNYDLLWNAFYFLSRKDEWDLEQKGVSIQSYSGKTSRKNEESWSIPIVNYYFKILKDFISRNFDNLEFGKQSEPILELSHDLDYIKKTNSLRIKQSMFNFLNGIKNLDTKKLKKALKFAFSKQDYWNFDYWTKIEKSYHLKSTF